MRPLGAPNWCFVTVRHDHQQVDIAAIVGLPYRVRAEEPDLLRLKLLCEPARYFIEQVLAESSDRDILTNDFVPRLRDRPQRVYPESACSRLLSEFGAGDGGGTTSP